MEAELRWESQSPEEAAEAIRELPDVLTRKLKTAADDIGVRIRDDAQANAPVDETRLRDSISSLVESVGSTIVKVVVGTNVDYAKAHEYGTEPFFPPPSELRGWARRVLGDADAAYPVARSISETGISEKRYLRDAVENNMDWILGRIERAVKEAFDEVGFGV
jgi:hypothetical protein